jgi:hypothetical protein
VVHRDDLKKRVRGLVHPKCKAFLALGRDTPQVLNGHHLSGAESLYAFSIQKNTHSVGLRSGFLQNLARIKLRCSVTFRHN